MPRVREMADTLTDISVDLAYDIERTEKQAEILDMVETFPEMLCRIIKLIDNDCDCKECRINLVSMECSILADYDGYYPELLRLSRDHPNLYEMHSGFFDEVVSGVDRERMINTRFRILADDEIEPILIRADGSEINPVVETYRREGRKIGRNDICPCGSGKKYKKCCSE
jgi:uncharacterized protein YecA (UPF0149 family)